MISRLFHSAKGRRERLSTLVFPYSIEPIFARLEMTMKTALYAWLNGYQRMLSFRGRERRRDFLCFLVGHYPLFYLLVTLIKWSQNRLSADATLTSFLLFCAGLASLCATLAYNVRRLHDSNRSGLLCIGYFLLAAPIVILVSLWLAPRNAGNRYGLDPRRLRA
ncbi:DUF805 domain-containing protein [Burkholderia sp. KBS0801]|nr:DUF805 domain-containing protein [Burkholderia sp. KBS0801]